MQRAIAYGGAESSGTASATVIRSKSGATVVVIAPTRAEKRPPATSPADCVQRLNFARAGFGVAVGGSGVGEGTGVSVGVGVGPTVDVGVRVGVRVGVFVGEGVADGVEA